MIIITNTNTDTNQHMESSSNQQQQQQQRPQPRPRLERRNAVRNINYEAADTCHTLRTRSLDLDLSSPQDFRILGDSDGEIYQICHRLGLSGPEDLAIPTAAWEAIKIRSSSDISPLFRFRHDPYFQDQDKEEIDDPPQELDNLPTPTSSSSFSTKGSGIKGIRPPVLAPPPAILLPTIDDTNTGSTWDLLKSFGPPAPTADTLPSTSKSTATSSSSSDTDGDEVAAAANNLEETEVEVMRLGETTHLLSQSCSTSHDDGDDGDEDDDDSSSVTTDPMFISPNAIAKCRRSINSWIKGNLLGSGSFGTVYEGLSDDGFFFAVKEVSLLDQGIQAKQSILQLEQEISLLSQFEHENIVQYLGTNKDEAKLYIFLELVTQGSLAQLYQKYPLPDTLVSAYTRQILHGLKYLHDRNVVHRDIKCANILVDASGSVKLADFGLAKATTFNDVKSCKGTAFWMAPEVVNRKGNGYGLPADIWSLGCTVLEMLTRQIPYSNLEYMQALFRIGRGKPPPIPDYLSGAARDFIVQCLQVRVDDRPTAGKLLRHAFVDRPLSASSASASPSHNNWRRI